MAPADLRLRSPSPELLALPWDTPLAEWDPTEVPLRDVPVGPSRHLVRFVELRGVLFAVKEMPTPLVHHEYGVLSFLQRSGLPAVLPVGGVDQRSGNGLLVTRYLDRSWQYRRLFLRLPHSGRHRQRLLDAMATLLVELHRHGVFWGDCSLANTLFVRDGQLLQAHLVDAETAEVHAAGLSDGQRRYDLQILEENVVGGLFDVAARLEESDELERQADDAQIVADAHSVVERYEQLWEELHRELVFGPDERYKVEAQLRRLNDMGFAVDEVHVEPVGDGREDLRLAVAVAGRRFHAEELRRRTGLDVGEGQATILLNDLAAYQARTEQRRRTSLHKDVAALGWMRQVFEPGVERVQDVAPGRDPVQAFCDLLEVRWLLSEQAGHDVGDDVALEALAGSRTPDDSVAQMSVVEADTVPIPVVRDDDLRPGARSVGEWDDG